LLDALRLPALCDEIQHASEVEALDAQDFASALGGGADSLRKRRKP
jgi:hypothetical protein